MLNDFTTLTNFSVSAKALFRVHGSDWKQNICTVYKKKVSCHDEVLNYINVGVSKSNI